MLDKKKKKKKKEKSHRKVERQIGYSCNSLFCFDDALVDYYDYYYYC